MHAIYGVRQRPPTEFIHYRVAQRRESPSTGDHSQLRLTPLPPGEFTASLLPGNFRRYLLRRFFTALWFLLEFGNFEAPASADSRPGALDQGLQKLLQTELQQ
jgi:hypothetical protein